MATLEMVGSLEIRSTAGCILEVFECGRKVGYLAPAGYAAWIYQECGGCVRAQDYWYPSARAAAAGLARFAANEARADNRRANLKARIAERRARLVALGIRRD